MSKYFYSHIVETSEISLSIAEMDMPNEDRVKLITLAEESLHHAILDHILSELSEADKKELLGHLNEENHSKAWLLINEKINDADSKIINIAQSLKKQFKQDIEESLKNGDKKKKEK